MKIGILATGHVRDELTPAHGDVTAMVSAMFAEARPDFRFVLHDVVNGAPIPAPDAADAWFVPGSRHGVYDPLPWMAPAMDFLRAARAGRKPILGVCFGHQLLAQAFGGRAEKFSGGWRLGAQDYAFAPAPWAPNGLPASARLHANHQDQVTAVPDDAAVWLSNDGCRYAGLSYGDPADPDAVTVQPHPEFRAPYARALVDYLTAKGTLAADVGAEAAARIGGPVDNALLARLTGDWLAAAVDARVGA